MPDPIPDPATMRETAKHLRLIALAIRSQRTNVRGLIDTPGCEKVTGDLQHAANLLVHDAIALDEAAFIAEAVERFHAAEV